MDFSFMVQTPGRTGRGDVTEYCKVLGLGVASFTAFQNFLCLPSISYVLGTFSIGLDSGRAKLKLAAEKAAQL